MNVDDAVARILRGHARVLLLCVLLPVLVVSALHVARASSRLYQSTERIQLGLQVASSNVEADAISTKAEALASSEGFVRNAAQAAKVQRDARTIARDRVQVRRVGLSAVVDLSVSDRSPRVAQALTTALGQQLMQFLDTAGRQPETEALRALDQRSADLNKEREGVLQAARLDPPPAAAAAGSKDPLTQALAELATERSQLTVQRLTALDQELAELASQRGKLTLEQASRPAAAVVDAASLPSAPLSDGLSQALELALLLGLLLGLAVAGSLELVRPTVPTPRSLARLLRTPLLGRLPAGEVDPDVLRELVERVELTARRHEVGGIVLVPVCAPADAVARLEAAAAAGRARVPVQVSGGRPASGVHVAGAPVDVGWHVISAGDADADRSADKGYGVLDSELARADRRAGGVIVAPPCLHVRDLDAARDLFEATGWPLLGVLTVPGGAR